MRVKICFFFSDVPEKTDSQTRQRAGSPKAPATQAAKMMIGDAKGPRAGVKVPGTPPHRTDTPHNNNGHTPIGTTAGRAVMLAPTHR
jgi:hypothetical protein